MRIKVSILCGFILMGCAHTPSEPVEEIDRPPSASLKDNSLQYQQADTFHRFARGELSPADSAALIAECKKPNDNPFCWSVKKQKTLKEHMAVRARIPPAATKREIAPTAIKIKNGKITNWQRLRRADIPELLKGIEGLSKEDFELMRRQAKNQKGCPNNVAIGVAAHLEDELPNTTLAKEIAELYAKAGQCRNHDSTDRENFLTRAALFHVQREDYESAYAILSKVKPTDALSGRALYWLYEVERKLGRKSAEKTYARLTSQHRFSFHSLLAQDDRNASLPTSEMPPKVPSRSKRQPGVNPMIVQVELLFKYGFYDTAGVLVEWALDRYSRLEPGVKLYLASMGDAKSQVQTATEVILFSRDWTTQKTLELAYPRAYLSAFAANGSNINPMLLLSVARKESLFNAKAVSHANARGLLQMTPDTAAKLSGGEPDLLDPNTNVQLAAKYLDQLLDKNDKKLHYALACYNAGEEPVAKWRKRFPTKDPVLFVDLIPYRETRDYVGFVLSNYYWYKKLYEPELAKTSVLRELRTY